VGHQIGPGKQSALIQNLAEDIIRNKYFIIITTILMFYFLPFLNTANCSLHKILTAQYFLAMKNFFFDEELFFFFRSLYLISYTKLDKQNCTLLYININYNKLL